MTVDAQDRCQTVSDPGVVAISGSIFCVVCSRTVCVEAALSLLLPKR